MTVVKLWALIAVIVCSSGAIAHAHGDEPHDHGDEAKKSAVAVESTEHTQTIAGDNGAFEVVVKVGEPHPGEVSPVTLYLSDYESNTPVSKATLRLEWEDGLNSNAEETSTAGIYRAQVTFPQVGDFTPIIHLKSGDVEDFFPLETIKIAPEESVPVEHSTKWWPVSVGGLVAFLLAGWWWSRQKGAAHS